MPGFELFSDLERKEVNDVLDNLTAYDVTTSNNRFLMLRQPHPVRIIHLISGWQSSAFTPPDE